MRHSGPAPKRRSSPFSRFNTSPHGHPFDLYDNRQDLGNTGPPDGERYRGRGFIQLTGRANGPDIAARLLARFIKSHELRIKDALLVGDLAAARRLVNGGSHGVAEFVAAYRTGQRLIPDAVDAIV